MRITASIAILSFTCAMASATDREFKDVVAAISDEFHTRPLHIPFFGLVNVVTFVARPAGTKHIDLAVFENLDSRDVPQAIRRAVGGAWKPFVQVWSHRETVLVYVRMEGRDCKLLVASVENNEATVVQLRLNPEALQRWIATPREAARHRGE